MVNRTAVSYGGFHSFEQFEEQGCIQVRFRWDFVKSVDFDAICRFYIFEKFYRISNNFHITLQQNIVKYEDFVAFCRF
jgi:hypothetical protein